jgi:hypothetical protein
MDFSDKELKVLLQALYRFRGEVSGASQTEQNKFGVVSSVIDKIESKVGPLKVERTRFDREMDESLSILATGRMGAAKAARETREKAELDKEMSAPKVMKGAGKSAGPKPAAAKGKKSAGAAKAAASKPKSK